MGGVWFGPGVRRKLSRPHLRVQRCLREPGRSSAGWRGGGRVEASLVFGGTARLSVVAGFKEEEGETNTIAKCHMTAFSMLVLTSRAPLSDGESDVIFPNFGLEAGVGPTPRPCGKGNALGFTPGCLLPAEATPCHHRPGPAPRARLKRTLSPPVRWREDAGRALARGPNDREFAAPAFRENVFALVEPSLPVTSGKCHHTPCAPA